MLNESPSSKSSTRLLPLESTLQAALVPLHALQLQRVASQQLRASGYALTTVACLNAAPSAPLPEACLAGSAKAAP